MPSGPNFQVVVELDVMVPMRDGVHLAADIYHPAINGQPLNQKIPALLERTPYDKGDLESSSRAAFFARHGYVTVVQDCRGCFESEGELYFLVNEPRDGYDTIEWIARQPWSDGKIGTYGYSYASWAQSAAAIENPPHLTCMFPTMGGWNGHASSIRQGGALELRWLAWAFWHSTLNKNRNLKKNRWIDKILNFTDAREWFTRLPIKRGHTPLALVPNYEQWCLDLFTHADYDDYWRQPGFAIEEYLEQHADVPVHLCGSWYDSYTRSTLEAFTALIGTKRSNIKVIMGPWLHGAYTTELSDAGDIDLGPTAALQSFNEMHQRWFDHWLKGVDNGIDREPPVRIFIMGGGSGHKNGAGRLDHGGYWRCEQEWPLARTKYTNFYLHADDLLSISPPELESAQTSYLSDPDSPVPTIGGNLSALDYLKPPPPNVNPYLIPLVARLTPITPMGGFDQQEGPQFFGCKQPYLPLATRPDVLVFQSEPMKEDTEITGSVIVKLWVSSSAPDTDFTAK
ncbi:CocE/NonD family hydrolase, partial [Chloroflexota bacterium]